MKILLVEDDELLRRALVRLVALVAPAATTYAASDYPCAVVMLESVDPDLIICDFHLGMHTGGDVLRWIKENKPHLIDAFVFHTSSIHARRYHARVIEKPCSIDALRQLIAEGVAALT